MPHLLALFTWFGGLDPRQVADTLGYPAAAIGILIESAGIPFPGETFLLAAAAWAAMGHLDIRVVILVAAAGAVAGADVGYGAGRLGGRPFVERFGHLLHLNPSRLARAELFFIRYGGRAVLASRFVLGLRTWASVLAGVVNMPFMRFQAFSALGGAAWATLMGSVGYLLGRHWSIVVTLVRDLGAAGLALVALLGLLALIAGRRAAQA